MLTYASMHTLTELRNVLIKSLTAREKQMIMKTDLSIDEATALDGVSFLASGSSYRARDDKFQGGARMEDSLRVFMRLLFPPVIYKKETRKVLKEENRNGTV